VKAPEVAGLKVTEMEQWALEERAAEQVFVWEKLEESVPAIEMELMVSSWLPVLTREKVCGALLKPAVAVKLEAVEGKSAAAGPLTGWTGLPVMANP